MIRRFSLSIFLAFALFIGIFSDMAYVYADETACDHSPTSAMFVKPVSGSPTYLRFYYLDEVYYYDGYEGVHRCAYCSNCGGWYLYDGTRVYPHEGGNKLHHFFTNPNDTRISHCFDTVVSSSERVTETGYCTSILYKCSICGQENDNLVYEYSDLDTSINAKVKYVKIKKNHIKVGIHCTDKDFNGSTINVSNYNINYCWMYVSTDKNFKNIVTEKPYGDYKYTELKIKKNTTYYVELVYIENYENTIHIPRYSKYIYKFKTPKKLNSKKWKKLKLTEISL